MKHHHPARNFKANQLLTLFSFHPLITSCLMLFTYLCFAQYTKAQDISTVYGKVGSADFNYKKCDFDSLAQAVVLFDLGQTHFEDTETSYDVVFERHTRIKVIKDGGEKWGRIEILYYTSDNIDEKVEDIKATSYNNDNGNVTKTDLSLKDCHIERINNHWLLKKFAIPNVKAGTVIEYSYSINSQYVFNLRDWNFQWKIPVLYSEYVVKLIPFYQYTFSLQSASKFDSKTSEKDDQERSFGGVIFRDMIHTFVMQSIPAFQDEEFITSVDDYIMKLDFQLSKIIYPNGQKKEILTTWPQLKSDLTYNDNFGSFEKKSRKMAKSIFALKPLKTMTNKEKFETVVDYVKQNYSWDKNYGVYCSKKVTDLMMDKYGNSADLNLFCIGLLNGVGINAKPLLISTRNHGKIKVDYPFLDSFNNVIIQAQIDSTIVLSDATDLLLDNKRIPQECINGQGLVIDKDEKAKWTKLGTKAPSKEQTIIISNIKSNKIESKFSISANDYSGLYLHRKFGLDKIQLLKQISNKRYEVVDSSLQIKDMLNANDAFSYQFSAATKPESLKNKLYISPFFNEVINVNPLKQKERNYPIDLIFVHQMVYVSSFNIPEGYKIEFLPDNKEIDNNQFEMSYKTEMTDNNIIRISFSYNFKQPEYDAADYNTLKGYFNELINKANEKVVLIKKAR